MKQRRCLGVLCVSVSLAGCGEPAARPADARQSALPPGQVRVTETSPIHWKVAALDARGNVVSESAFQSYEQVFARLDGKCSNGRSAVADLAQVAVKGLQEKGKRVSRLEFLQGLDASIPDEMPKGDCRELAAALWTLMEAR